MVFEKIEADMDVQIEKFQNSDKLQPKNSLNACNSIYAITFSKFSRVRFIASAQLGRIYTYIYPSPDSLIRHKDRRKVNFPRQNKIHLRGAPNISAQRGE